MTLVPLRATDDRARKERAPVVVAPRRRRAMDEKFIVGKGLVGEIVSRRFVIEESVADFCIHERELRDIKSFCFFS